MKRKLLTTTVIPVFFGAGFVVGGAFITGPANAASVPNSTQNANGGLLPMAKPKQQSIQLAQCSGCNPCAAKCNPCNPCAAAGCNPCNPCAAKCNPCNPCAAKCNPCNPCQSDSGMIQLAQCSGCNPCNPCAAAGCNPCNPCAAAKCNPCNPCAASGCNPCNPCAAKCNPCNPCAAAGCNPCNPCAAAGCNPCNPCGACNPCSPCAAGGGAASNKCVVPRLAGGCNPCNPCAAANPCNPCGGCNPCNPCAAAGCNPCNPCAASACNPCNPCAAAGCNPCNPCGGGSVAEITPCEAAAVYECLKGEMNAAYAKSGWSSVKGYQGWLNVAKTPYQSGTHGGRFVNNYVDSHGDYRYAKYEDAGTMPLGSTLAKDSFVVKANGKVSMGPLFVMEKMSTGFNKESGDWRYTLIMPNGKVIGTTNGKNSKAVAFCNDCHSSVAEDQDYMLFLPEEDRK